MCQWLVSHVLGLHVKVGDQWTLFELCCSLQVVHDIQHVSASGDISSLTFYLDGAHTPESMITCADWFSEVVQPPSGADSSDTSNTSVQQVETTAHNTPEPLSTTNVDCQRVLLFNCMKERDASTLLHQLQSSMLQRGVHAQHAVFVPPDSHYSFLSSSSTAEAAKQLNVDVSWQAQLRDVWQACCESGEPSTAQTGCSLPPLPAPPGRWGVCGLHKALSSPPSHNLTPTPAPMQFVVSV